MPLVYRDDLTQVYLDPKTAREIRAYIPETHSSKNCERALAGGQVIPLKEARDPIWCEFCVTPNRELADIVKEDGVWVNRTQEQL